MDDKNLKKLFSEIIQGFSEFDSPDFGFVYIKHFGILESSEIENKYNYFYEKALQENTPTIKQKEEYLLGEKLWTKKQDNKIKELKDFLVDLEATLSKEYLKSKRTGYKKDITDISAQIRSMEQEKQSLIGTTAESYAVKKSNEIYIKNSFYKDKNFNDFLFLPEEFDDLSQEKLDGLIRIYNTHTNNYSPESIKKLALSPMFLNMFYLASDNPQVFYGKPVIHLTFHQVDIFGMGRYFKSILTEYGDKVPKNILNNPDELIEFIECRKNAKDILDDSEESGASSIVGGTKEDLLYLGVDSSRVMDFNKEAKKLGKTTLNKDDFLNMHG